MTVLDFIKKNKFLSFLILITAPFLIYVTACLWALIPRIIAGGTCLDFVSGQVPPEAESMFMDKLFTDIGNEDYSWITQIADEDALEEIKALKVNLEGDYNVIYGDDLAGTYDRTVEFETGTIITLYYDGIWHECPDEHVTLEEVEENIRLSRISVRDSHPFSRNSN